MNDSGKLVKEIDKLEPMPIVVTRLSSIIANPKSTIDDIVNVISYDPSLVANLLQWANSALWARRNLITIVKDAILHLGAWRIMQVVVGKHLKSSMEEDIPEYGLNSKELWKHAIASSLAAEELNCLIKVTLPLETYTIVLLHDIGKLIMKQMISPEKLNAIIELSNSNGITYYDAEKKILGFTHAEVGFEMTKQWKFSESISKSILYHHDPEKHTNPITDAVHISNISAKTIGIGLGNEGLNLFGSSDSAKRLGLSVKDFERVCYKVKEKIPEIEKLYEL